MSNEYSSTSSISHESVKRIKRRPRKVRCTQEFNDLDRKSIFSVPSNGESIKSMKTRKQANIQFLPKIQLYMDAPTNKENVMLNGNNSPSDEIKLKKSKRTRKHKVETDLPQIEIPETLTGKSKGKKKCHSSTSEQSDPATETEHTIDAEVVFKRKRKIKKGKKQVETIETKLTSELNPENNEEIEHDMEKPKSKLSSSEIKIVRQSILRKKSSLPKKSSMDIANCEIPSGNILVEHIATVEDDLEDDQELNHYKASIEQGRKSVRFISPSKNSVSNKRSTFDIQNNTIDISTLKSIGSIEESIRSENSFKSYRKSPHVNKIASRLHLNVDVDDNHLSPDKADAHKGNLDWSSPSFSENEPVTDIPMTETIAETPNNISDVKNSLFINENSTQKSNNDRSDFIDYNQTLNKTPSSGKNVLATEKSVEKMNGNKQNQNEIPSAIKAVSGRRSTFEMPSPIFGPEKIEIDKNITTASIKPKSYQQKISIVNLVTPTASPEKDKNEDSVVIIESAAKKLTRESTFTRYERMCEGMDETKDATSPLDADQTFTKDKVASKQTDRSLKRKRRTWNKSLGVAILDNSGHLQNIISPWTREMKDASIQEKETPKGNKAMLAEKSETSRPKVAKTPPSGTSTPLPADKKHLLRAALLKESRVKIDESKNTTRVVPKPKKMPNFAEIHKRAYDKMENLQEMSERKASRAKLLLSGQKPALQTSCKRKSPNKNKKLLQYSPRMATIQTQTTPKLASNLVTKVKAITPSTSNPKVLPKSVELPKMKSLIPKLRNNKIVAEKKGFTKLGVKGGAEAKNATREEQVKAFINKSKVMTSTVDKRRTDIKNVRTNRRFELLMKMRNMSKP